MGIGGLTAGLVVTERQAELLFGMGRHPDIDRVEPELLDDGTGSETSDVRAVLCGGARSLALGGACRCCSVRRVVGDVRAAGER